MVTIHRIVRQRFLYTRIQSIVQLVIVPENLWNSSTVVASLIIIYSYIVVLNRKFLRVVTSEICIRLVDIVVVLIHLLSISVPYNTPDLSLTHR